MNPMRKFLALAALALLPVAAFAQQWPTKPVRFLIPYPPGGSAEILARPIAQKLTEAWGQSVVLDFRGGAGGTIATDILAKSPPDGHSIIMVLAAHAINHSLYAKLPYDTLRDFAPVSLTASLPLIVVTPPSVPANSVKELIALAKAKPNSINFASAGNGNTSHLAGELFKTVAGVEMVHVPYKGSGPSLIALLGGEVQLMFDSLSSSLPHVRSGKLRGLAVTSAKRSHAIPQLPTVGEAGLANFVVDGWYGILAPAGTPPAIVNKMSADIARMMQIPDTRERIMGSGYDIVGSTPEQFSAHIRNEVERWSKVVKASGARID